MALKAGSNVAYDLRSDSYQGNSTLPGHNEKEASKAAREGGERRKKYDEKECQWDREWR